jgi:hypothetical protein
MQSQHQHYSAPGYEQYIHDPYASRDPPQHFVLPAFEQDRAVQAGHTHEAASLADHIARDSGVRVVGDSAGPALTEEEFKLASGAFDAAKYEEYNRQV